MVAEPLTQTPRCDTRIPSGGVGVRSCEPQTVSALACSPMFRQVLRETDTRLGLQQRSTKSAPEAGRHSSHASTARHCRSCRTNRSHLARRIARATYAANYPRPSWLRYSRSRNHSLLGHEMPRHPTGKWCWCLLDRHIPIRLPSGGDRFDPFDGLAIAHRPALRSS